jgi:hypothetical protein
MLASSANVTFKSIAITETKIDGCMNVTDPNVPVNPLGTACGDDANPTTFTYAHDSTAIQRAPARVTITALCIKSVQKSADWPIDGINRYVVVYTHTQMPIHYPATRT